MTHVEMILEMGEMQKKLDEALLEKGRALGKIEEYDRDRCTFALIDELGELTHELKGDWCWWKATQKPVDRAKVLEELVDAYHFGLSLDNHGNNLYCTDLDYMKNLGYSPLKCITWVISSARMYQCVTKKLYSLTYALGFTMEEVYQGYIEKNKENYERIERGY